MKMSVMVATCAALVLSSCAQDRCATSSNPVECRAWSNAGGDIDDYLIGAAVGYMMANRGGQTVIIRDPNYHGSYRPLRRPLMSEASQVRALKAKVERQRVELRRQQQANLEKKKAMKASGSSWGSSSSSNSSRRSFSSSSSSRRRK